MLEHFMSGFVILAAAVFEMGLSCE